MLLPPRGDPQRDLHRSADETKSLGLCMIGLGALSGTCLMTNVMMIPAAAARNVYLLVFLISCGGFGLFYVYAAKHIRVGKAWAPTAILAVTAAQAMWVVGSLAWAFWRDPRGIALALFLPSALWLTALGVVAYYALRSARAIRLLMLDGPGGFEVPVHVLPVTETVTEAPPAREERRE